MQLSFCIQRGLIPGPAFPDTQFHTYWSPLVHPPYTWVLHTPNTVFSIHLWSWRWNLHIEVQLHLLKKKPEFQLTHTVQTCVVQRSIVIPSHFKRSGLSIPIQILSLREPVILIFKIHCYVEALYQNQLSHWR